MEITRQRYELQTEVKKAKRPEQEERAKNKEDVLFEIRIIKQKDETAYDSNGCNKCNFYADIKMGVCEICNRPF